MGLSEARAQATVRTAALVGGDRALQVIAAFRGDDRYEVGHELSDAWGRFPTADYADAVLAGAPMRTTHLHIRTPGQLAAFAGLPHIRRVYLTSDNGIPREITERRDLEWLVVEHNPGVADLSVLSGHRALRHLGVFDCPGVTSIEPVAELTADSLAFGYVQNGLSLAPLAGIPGLRSLVIGFEPKERHIGDVPAAEGLTKLTLWQGARGLSLDGLERWPALTSLAIAGDWQYGQFVGRRPLTGLTSLQIRYTAPVEVAHLLPYRRLTELMLLRCGLMRRSGAAAGTAGTDPAADRRMRGDRGRRSPGRAGPPAAGARPAHRLHRDGADRAGAAHLLLVSRSGGQPGCHQTRTEPPRAKAGLVACGGMAVRGSAISETRGPCLEATASRSGRSKP